MFVPGKIAYPKKPAILASECLQLFPIKNLELPYCTAEKSTQETCAALREEHSLVSISYGFVDDDGQNVSPNQHQAEKNPLTCFASSRERVTIGTKNLVL